VGGKGAKEELGEPEMTQVVVSTGDGKKEGAIFLCYLRKTKGEEKRKN